MLARVKFGCFLLAGAVCLTAFAVSSPAQDQKPARVKKVLAKQVKAVPAPDPLAETPPPSPPPPLTLAQKPAIPPKVTFQHGQLTIVAENSTLGDILRAVRSKIGAAMDVPGNATERVVTQLGPGPVHDVLASLLNGSHFNYVILGSATNPDAVQQVILTPKSGEMGTAPPPRQQAKQSDDGEDQPEAAADDAAADDSNNDADNQPEQPQPEEQPQQPAAPVKSPEELLRELQQQQQQLQMQQQLQQQQQQQQPQNSEPPQNPPEQ
ncbi:MAG TPA: hypothetical protein VLW84_14965 [Terriglobales bacterium]|nr:hypothetical protein [Terriglobales bacterium]